MKYQWVNLGYCFKVLLVMFKRKIHVNLHYQFFYKINFQNIGKFYILEFSFTIFILNIFRCAATQQLMFLLTCSFPDYLTQTDRRGVGVASEPPFSLVFHFYFLGKLEGNFYLSGNCGTIFYPNVRSYWTNIHINILLL